MPPPLELAKEVLDAFRRNGLPNFASAMAFQALLALVPFLLFVLALIGFLNLEEIWQQDVAPEIRGSTSESAFRLIDETVTRILDQKQAWWLTAGLALTLWELSAATRVTMSALDRVYGFHRRRSIIELLPRSLALGAAMGLCVIGAVAVVRFGPLVTDELGSVLSFFVRWLVATALLGVGVALTVHFGSATRQPAPWVSIGTGLVLLAWVVTSIAFGAWITLVASYGSVFSHLATFFVLLLYVWLLANAFLVGIQVDACLRKRA